MTDFESAFLHYSRIPAWNGNKGLQETVMLDEATLGQFLKSFAVGGALTIGSAATGHARPKTDAFGQYQAQIMNTSHSMPFAGVNLECVRIPYKDLKPGMVVQYANPWFDILSGGRGAFAAHSPNKFNSILHRLVKLTSKGWIVKGDNNEQHDPGFLTEQNYWGVVVGVGNTGEVDVKFKENADKYLPVLPDHDALQAAADTSDGTDVSGLASDK